MTTQGEVILPGQELAVSGTIIDSRSLAELVSDEHAIKAALEWGISAQEPAASELGAALYDADEWTDCGPVQYARDYDDYGSTLVVRPASADPTVAQLHQTISKLYDEAETNVESRDGYNYAVQRVGAAHRGEQRRNVLKRLASSVLGGAALAGAAAATEAFVTFAYQPNPILFGAGWATAEVVKGTVKAVKLFKNHTRDIERLSPSELPSDAQEKWEQLASLFEKIPKQYTTETKADDVVVWDEEYKMNLREVAERLDESGGPELEDYAPILKDLSIGSDGKERKLVLINPATIVEQLVNDSEGRVWSGLFASVVTMIGVAQQRLMDSKAERDSLPKKVKKVPGIDGRSRDAELKEDIEKLKDAIRFGVLQLYKLNLDLDDNQTEPDDPIDDVYAVPDDVVRELEGSSDAEEAERATGTNHWELLQNGIPQPDKA